MRKAKKSIMKQGRTPGSLNWVKGATLHSFGVKVPLELVTKFDTLRNQKESRAESIRKLMAEFIGWKESEKK